VDTEAPTKKVETMKKRKKNTTTTKGPRVRIGSLEKGEGPLEGMMCDAASSLKGGPWGGGKWEE